MLLAEEVLKQKIAPLAMKTLLGNARPIHDGVMTVNKTGGSIETKRKFKDYQLHVEYKIPASITGTGQGRGNSGVFLA